MFKLIFFELEAPSQFAHLLARCEPTHEVKVFNRRGKVYGPISLNAANFTTA